MVELEELPLDSPLSEALALPPRAPRAVALDWLGQAGFALRSGGRLIIIDPYLSDTLALKYRGKELPHLRMMPSPLAPQAVRGVSMVLCTHRHTDHMDPGTLPVIAKANPECLFVVPRSETAHALSLGIPESRLRTMDAGDSLRPAEGIQVDAIASAHEQLARNERGELLHLGYIAALGGLRIYHSGDCVPYEGLEETLRAMAIDVALLPVNGRSEYLSSRGIMGNFFLEETVQLCRTAGIGLLFCHHWGMFDFNTIDPGEAARKIAEMGNAVRCVMPRVGVTYLVRKT
ncbi:MAG: MBL fold metallo-hydrolase [Spirochaetia bacterium]|jgi:L-ascorbate metabolism protein UlaG (beta-lactamase superfamily)